MRASGVHRQTGYRWFGEDRVPEPARRLESGTIGVEVAPADASGRVVVYARVSSHDQRHDSGGPARGLGQGERACGRRGGDRGRVRAGREAADGGALLSDPSASVVVVEHRDRLTRFGVEHVEAALPAYGRKVVVTDPGERAGDLVRDMIEVLTSMCARLYGRRGARNRAMRAVTAARGGEAGAGG